MPTLIRVILFLSAARHDEWTKDRLRQQAELFDSETEQQRFTGQFSRYPLSGIDLFANDQYRFVCEHDTILGDVYVSFLPDDLYDEAKKQKDKTLGVLRNDQSGGLDFHVIKGKMPDSAVLRQRTADWRWVPVLLPDTFANHKPKKTYIVINHPEKICGHFAVGTKKREEVELFMPTTILQAVGHRLRLIGWDTDKCERIFFQDPTLQIRRFLQFIRNHRSQIYRF